MADTLASTSKKRGVFRDDLVCISCGITFAGHIKSNRCPACRREKKLLDGRLCKQRARVGKTRQLGSTDLCAACGQPYTVNSPLQRYCPACAPEAVRANIRKAARERTSAYYAIEEHRAAKNAARALPGPTPRICVVCGKQFAPGTRRLTCSPECLAKQRRSYMETYDKSRAESRKEYTRAYYKAIASDPEKRAEYNQKAREAYARRKSTKEEITNDPDN